MPGPILGAGDTAENKAGAQWGKDTANKQNTQIHKLLVRNKCCTRTKTGCGDRWLGAECHGKTEGKCPRALGQCKGPGVGTIQGEFREEPEGRGGRLGEQSLGELGRPLPEGPPAGWTTPGTSGKCHSTTGPAAQRTDLGGVRRGGNNPRLPHRSRCAVRLLGAQQRGGEAAQFTDTRPTPGHQARQPLCVAKMVTPALSQRQTWGSLRALL